MLAKIQELRQKVGPGLSLFVLKESAGGAEVGGKDWQAARRHHRGGFGRKAVAGRVEGPYRCRRLTRFGGHVSDGLKEVIREAGNSIH